MRFIRTVFLLLSIASCTMSGIAQARHWRGNVPFSFKIKNQTFSAGVYDISLDADNGIVSLSSDVDRDVHMTWIGIPSDRRSTAIMRFVLSGDSYVLTSVAAGSWATLPPHAPKGIQEAVVTFPR